MNKYQILWIDDEYEKQDAFIESAYLKGIEITAVKTSKEGMQILEDNLFDFDGVILDAKVFDESEDEVAELTGLSKSIFKIKELKSKKYIPYYVYTGQPGLYDDKTFKQMLGGVKYYKKPNDKDQLFNDIKISADKLFDTNLKHKYSDAFLVFEKGIISGKYRHNLIEMLTCIENKDYKKKNLTVIRDLLESVYDTLIYNYMYIPDTILNSFNKPNLEGCTMFLEGRKTWDIHKIKHENNSKLPDEIFPNFRLIKNKSTKYSHLNENDILKNAFISSAYAMLEVLEWLPQFIKENFE